ncbi:MAG: hypothetical protein ACXAE3_15400 [Candidatus Kariarchaeaceae archaeon]|jgi:hypothetical protein
MTVRDKDASMFNSKLNLPRKTAKQRKDQIYADEDRPYLYFTAVFIGFLAVLSVIQLLS